jgi:hypothetical protein
MNRKDTIAAQVFLRGLDEGTCEALESRLLAKVSAGEERPDVTTRQGLALIAFTTKEEIDCTDAEHSEAIVRVTPLWTEEEAERYLKYWQESLGRGEE